VSAGAQGTQPQPQDQGAAAHPHEFEEGSVQWLWNQFCALRVEANAGSPKTIERMEWVLDTIIRYRLVAFITPQEAAAIPTLDTCEAQVRKEALERTKRAYAEVHTGWDEEELSKIVEGAIRRAAIEKRADPVARILSRLGWLEPLRPEKARA
jgi:hypothetical protein